jgi:hypothetical protein
VADAQVAAVGLRREVEHRPLDDPEAVFGEPQVADHLGVQQAHRVARERVAEARVELLGDGGAADHVAAFEQRDLEPARAR